MPALRLSDRTLAADYQTADLSGALSGYGHGGPYYVYKEEDDDCPGLNPYLAAAVMAGLAAATFIIFRYLTVNGRRRKRSLDQSGADEDDEDGWWWNVGSYLLAGE